MPPGLGKEGHWEAASRVQSPFQASFVVDDDIHYAARQIATFGPMHFRYRQHITGIMKKVERVLKPVEIWLVDRMHPMVKDVAEHKKPAAMAFCTVILRWPDRQQPSRYVKGFTHAGEIDSSHDFVSCPG